MEVVDQGERHVHSMANYWGRCEERKGSKYDISCFYLLEVLFILEPQPLGVHLLCWILNLLDTTNTFLKENKIKKTNSTNARGKSNIADIKGGFERKCQWQGRHLNNTQTGAATLGMCGINPSLNKALPI